MTIVLHHTEVHLKDFFFSCCHQGAAKILITVKISVVHKHLFKRLGKMSRIGRMHCTSRIFTIFSPVRFYSLGTGNMGLKWKN